MNNSSNNFVNVNSGSKNQDQYDRIIRMNSHQKNDYSSSVYDQRNIASKGSERRAPNTKYSNLNARN